MGERTAWTVDRPNEPAVENLLADGVDRELFTGVAAAVGSADGIDWQTTVGERDPRTGNPVTTETLFDGASTTKVVVTTTLVLRLVEAGVLALSAHLKRTSRSTREPSAVGSRSTTC